ncbi:hypothetical protein BSL78_12691 [Apostichopus japonicus]|uniref:Uncharacterized protein n=1 Tax=Stichopus japonicus TaxID=307972 RepID=A0A2G8KR21_STIJA|nr:hypothetical protein BSL78_12691 [Apostichopus japonicus]
MQFQKQRSPERLGDRSQREACNSPPTHPTHLQKFTGFSLRIWRNLYMTTSTWSFEITFNDALLFSKLDAGNFPETEKIVDYIRHHDGKGDVVQLKETQNPPAQFCKRDEEGLQTKKLSYAFQILMWLLSTNLHSYIMSYTDESNLLKIEVCIYSVDYKFRVPNIV